MTSWEWFLVWVGQHGLWFFRWTYAWFFNPSGILPWAEHNQGLLSIFALVTALVLALIEQRRAIFAEAFARASDAAQERRALEASRDADRRMTEANALADRTARAASAEADRKAAEKLALADIYERLKFISTVETLLAGFRLKIDDSKSTLTVAIEKTNDRDRPMPREWQNSADEIKSSLQAILPSAPRDPGIVLSTQRIIVALGLCEIGYTYTAPSSLIAIINERAKTVELRLSELTKLKPEIAVLPSRSRGKAARQP